MKILYLPLKKEWYEMIERGDKREEYRKSAERELANCSGRSRSNLDNEDDEDGFIKDSTLAPYIRNIIKQIDDQRRATAFKQLTLF